MKKVKIKFSPTSPITLLLVIGLIYFAIWTRLGTLKTKVILDYDPWWHYRYAVDILENNLRPKRWDLLSFFPPGRPVILTQLGWEYTMILFYKISSLLNPEVNFMYVAKLAPAIMVGLTVIPAYLLGRLISNNKWGGLLTALFAISAPAFVGVSMVGYCDTDAVVVFYSFLTIYSIILAMKGKKIYHYILAIGTCLIGMFNWWFIWYVLLFFLIFIPSLVAFRIIEDIVEKRRFEFDIKENIKKSLPLIKPLLIILVTVNILSTLLGFGNFINVFTVATGFLAGRLAIVNVSVAELQVINILTKEGFNQVAMRVGLIPTLLALIGLPILAIYKVFRKMEINFTEIFLFLWMLLTFYLILHGVRFSLLFTCAVAASSGYVIGNLLNYVKNKSILSSATVHGLVVYIALISISNVIQIGLASSGMEVEQEWIDMLDWLKSNADSNAIVTTWWDPGHIIAGYTGLRVHADGAHCSQDECIPYSHDVRIKDAGKVLVTNDEEEAIKILKKYMELTPEQCQMVKKKFKDIVPKEACEPASEMYFIASNDLIYKYPWHAYFGDWNNIQKQYLLLQLSGEVKDEKGNRIGLSYGDDTVIVLFKNNKLIPILNKRDVIKEILYFQNGELKDEIVENGTIGSVFLMEGFSGAIFMPIDHEESKLFLRCTDCKSYPCPESNCENGKDDNFNRLVDEKMTFAERDSLFTKMFFLNGEGLKHFKLVYSNPKIKLYKVMFD